MLLEEKAKLVQAFADAEASLRLEGLEPTANYYRVKERVLSGEITYDQGNAEILAHHTTLAHAVA